MKDIREIIVEFLLILKDAQTEAYEDDSGVSYHSHDLLDDDTKDKIFNLCVKIVDNGGVGNFSKCKGCINQKEGKCKVYGDGKTFDILYEKDCTCFKEKKKKK